MRLLTQAPGDLGLESSGWELTRGDVVMVDFDPAIGSELQKDRPAIVIAALNQGRLALVVPLTSKVKDSRDLVLQPPHGGIRRASKVAIEQVRTIDIARAGERLGRVTEGTIRQISKRLSKVFNLT